MQKVSVLNSILQIDSRWIALTLSSALLIGAWVFEYGFGYAPCQMCYWQRHVHKLVIVLAVFALIFQSRLKGPWKTLAISLIGLSLLGSAGLAAFHMGVEYKWWDGPKTCASGVTNLKLPDINPNDPFAIFDAPIKGPSCSDAVWHFLGLSMAAWNTILSLTGALFVFHNYRRP